MASTGQQPERRLGASAVPPAVDPPAIDRAGAHAAGPVSQETAAPGRPGTVSPGDCLAGRFVIQEELGRGGGGTVFVARDLRLERAVAIKVLTRALDAQALARFAQEARTAGALDHPHVLAVHDVGEHVGLPFTVPEVLRGRTLRSRLAEGPLPANEATALALQ